MDEKNQNPQPPPPPVNVAVPAGQPEIIRPTAPVTSEPNLQSIVNPPPPEKDSPYSSLNIYPTGEVPAAANALVASKSGFSKITIACIVIALVFIGIGSYLLLHHSHAVSPPTNSAATSNTKTQKPSTPTTTSNTSSTSEQSPGNTQNTVNSNPQVKADENFCSSSPLTC